VVGDGIKPVTTVDWPFAANIGPGGELNARALPTTRPWRRT
jgi:hypothetical protein